MKKALDSNLLSPLPVVLVGSLVDGRPNFLVIGYSAPFDFGKHLFFSIFKGRHTLKGILEHRTFSVNIPSVELIEAVEICGGRSGRDVDKSAIFKTFQGELKTAPMIEDCPISIECTVAQMLDYDQNYGVIGRVVKSYVDEACLVDDKLDMRLARPILWATGGDFHYYRLGERIVSEGPRQ
ncbi:MAG: flavin reductase family protein [candidate division WOR-3 bacterium]|nr:MAG: flavin reductase family protein [candidate division WOR-3 bacterium]